MYISSITFAFFKYLYLYKDNGLIEIRNYISNAKKAFPMLYFALSRNYGYAKLEC